MTVFKMPSLGADMEAAKLIEWKIAAGDTVAKGDVMAVVETQKGAIEVESFHDGSISRLLVEEGQTVPVGTPLAEFDGAGTAVEPVKPAPKEADRAPAPPPPAAPNVDTPSNAPRSSPAARRHAREYSIDLNTIQGTGPHGAITLEDVEAAAKTKQDKLAPAASKPASTDLGAMRKAIAAAMARSKREIPHYYLSHRIALSTAQAWLNATNAERGPEQRLLMGALLLKASALALARHPQLNGFYENGEFRAGDGVHCGMAVSIRGGGLIAPAIHHTDQLALDELMVQMRDLVNRTRSGGLRSSELTDATVTVSSLGERGVDVLYGVIYPPQVALIGFGTASNELRPTPAGIVNAPVITATLAADHRASDGHVGALLLRDIDKRLQTPEAL